jgi:uncharacterized protein YgbK (DUF1537 family)
MTTTDARPLLGFYGDDFTGSTDALESLALGGVPSVLFLETPGPEALRGRFAAVRAFGVAGVGRSLSPDQMDRTLPPVFEEMKRLMGSGVFHYKVCSTFDSSPEVGSIGRAIEIGLRVFGSRFVPLVVGAPALGRYCLFGNLFAAAGGDVYRIDRHPTMRWHPVTPMDEADLRLHLGRQTSRSIALMDLLQLSGTPAEVDRRFAAVRETGAEVVLFDVLDEPRLAEVGRLIWSSLDRGPSPLFAVGSSGLGHALTTHWRARGWIAGPASFPSPGAADRMIVVSGSCSPATRDQVERALARGFAGVAVDASRLSDPETAADERAAVMRRALEALADAPGVILATAAGPDDPRIATTMRWGGDRGEAPQATRTRLGEQLGMILRALLEASRIRRVVVAGGDTSGQVVRQLGLDALEILAPMASGAPLCRASSRSPAFDGLEIVLKGGQVGPVDVFERILQGVP